MASMLPTSIVDNDGFCKLVSKLNPRYDMPYKDHFSRLAIPSEKAKGDIQHKIMGIFLPQQICGHHALVSLTFA